MKGVRPLFLLHQLDHTIKKLKSQLANTVTLANLSLGAAAIISVLYSEYRIALLFITIAAFLDRIDGLIARKFHIESDFGKQLDSLSDIISFGVAPALLLHETVLTTFGYAGTFFTIFYIVCGAIRLARYNIMEVNKYFIGLPITAAGCILAFSFIFIDFLPSYQYMFLILILSLLMIGTFKIKKI